MSSNEPTLLAVVEKVIDVIGDAITNLLGQVVVLQEQNAPIPASLPKTGKSVVVACDRLVAVAKELAQDEYEDFPTIEKEIVDAANDVAAAADSLEKAIKNLQESKDRQGGWTRLVDACKVIAEMTVLLLQIVYGAEVKRIFALEKRAQQQVIDVDVEMVSENKKYFAELASAAASAAVELANCIRDKANEQALPTKRDALLQLADALEHQAKDVMDRANELLRLPGDKGRRDKLDDALTKLKKTMKDALVPLQEDYVAACQAQKWTFEGGNAQQVQRMTTDPADRKRAIDELIDAVRVGDKPRIREALDRVNWELDNVANLGKRILGVRPEASQALEQFNLKRRGLHPAVKEAEKDGVPKLEGFWADLMDAQAKLMDEIVPIEDRVMQLAQEQLADMDRIKRALRDGGDPNIVRITKNVFGTQKELVKAAEKCHNGWKKGKPKRMRECATAANGVLGGYVKGVQQSVADPNARGRTYKDSQDLALALEDMCAEALPIEEALIMAGDLQIKDLRGQHDPNRANWTELQDTIEQRGPKFERLAREAKDAKEAEDARRKLKIGKGKIPDDADVDEKLRKLRSVAEQQKEQARSDGPDWLRTNLRHVEAVQDAVAAALTPKSRLVYLGNRALEDLKMGANPDHFSRGPGQALSHHLDGMLDECGRVGGSFADPSARDRLKKLASQVNPLLEGVHAAAAKSNRNPQDPDARREFAKLNNRLQDLVRQIIQDVVLPTAEIQHLADRMVRALDQELDHIPAGKVKDVEAQNAEVEEVGERLADLADFAAKHSKDYAAKHRIRGAGTILRRDPPEYTKHTLRAVEAPSEKEPMRDVKTVDRRLRNAVETLVGDTATPEAQLSAIANQLIKHIDELSEGVRDGGDNIDVATMAGVEGALVKRLLAKVDLIKANMSDPQVAIQLAKASKDVNDLTPFHLGSVRDVMADPEKSTSQQQLTTDAQALKDAVLAVVAAAKSSPEEELRALRRLARDALQEGSGKALRGQGAPAEAKAVESAKAYADVERHARDVATRVVPSSKTPVLESEALETRTAVEDAPGIVRKVANDGGAPESITPSHTAAFKADSMAGALDRDAAARMKAEARKAQRALAGVAAGMQKGDPKEVAAGIRELARRFGELAQLAEAEAKSLGGLDEQALLDVVALMKAGIPDLSDAAIEAMESNWDAAPTGTAVTKAHKLAALASSIADGTFRDEANAAKDSVPSDDRRGKRLWNVSSPDFVGQDEIDAASKLEALLPVLINGAPEQTLLEAERFAGQLGRQEPSAGERLGQLARLADADLQHLVDAASQNRDIPELPALLNQTAETLSRSVEAALDELMSSEQQLSVKNAAAACAKDVPAAVQAAKGRSDMANADDRAKSAHVALNVIAEAFEPSPALSLLELRDKAGDALESLQDDTQSSSEKLQDVDRLLLIRVPLLRALGVAMRRAEPEGAKLHKKAEELARLWVSLPHDARQGSDLSETARRMDALLDELMQGTHAFAVGLAERINTDLGRLQGAVADEDQASAQSLAQGVVSDLKDLEAYINKMPNASADLKDAIKKAKAASINVIKMVPECLQQKQPLSALRNACAELRVPIAGVVAALWKDDASNFEYNLCQAEAAVASHRFDDALRHVKLLGKGAAVDAARDAIQKCKSEPSSTNVDAALRRLRILRGVAPERTVDADDTLDRARAQFAAEGLRCRRGAKADGAVEAAKRLIAGTRANYKRQNLESFDLSRLDAAAQKAKARAPRSLADVLAEIRKGRYERQKKREQAEEEAKRINIKPGGGGAFNAMQSDIDQNLKKMVVGSSLDFENERIVQLVRTIVGDFSTIGQYAAEKKPDEMISAGKQASLRITELVKELTALAKKTPDPRAANELMRAANVLKDFAVRAKLFCSIQAASIKSKGGEDSMLSFSKELGGNILTCLKVYYVARIKIYEKEKK